MSVLARGGPGTAARRRRWAACQSLPIRVQRGAERAGARATQRTVDFDALVDDGEDAVPAPALCALARAVQPTALKPAEQEPPAALRQPDVVPLVPPPQGLLVLGDVAREPQRRQEADQARVQGRVVRCEARQEVVGGVAVADEDEVEVRVDEEREEQGGQFGAVDVERVFDKEAQAGVALVPRGRVGEHVARRDRLVHPAADLTLTLTLTRLLRLLTGRGRGLPRCAGSVALCKVIERDGLSAAWDGARPRCRGPLAREGALEVGREGECGLVVTALCEVVEDGAVVGVWGRLCARGWAGRRHGEGARGTRRRRGGGEAGWRGVRGCVGRCGCVYWGTDDLVHA